MQNSVQIRTGQLELSLAKFKVFLDELQLDVFLDIHLICLLFVNVVFVTGIPMNNKPF